MTPHAFQPRRKGSQCSICGGWPDHSDHNLELFSDADRLREEARQLAQAQELSAILRTPKASIDRASGILERESPLFFGSGSNPGLF